jgi:hypothetical protein
MFSLAQYVDATTVLVKTSGFGCATFDCLGRALALDSAYRDLDAAKQLLTVTQKQHLNAPHTNAVDKAIVHIDQAGNFLRHFTVSPDTEVNTL